MAVFFQAILGKRMVVSVHLVNILGKFLVKAISPQWNGLQTWILACMLPVTKSIDFCGNLDLGIDDSQSLMTNRPYHDLQRFLVIAKTCILLNVGRMQNVSENISIIWTDCPSWSHIRCHLNWLFKPTLVTHEVVELTNHKLATSNTL